MSLSRLLPSSWMMLLVLALPLAACSDDDDDGKSSAQDIVVDAVAGLYEEAVYSPVAQYCDCEYDLNSSGHKECVEKVNEYRKAARSEAEKELGTCALGALDASGADEAANCYSKVVEDFRVRAEECMGSLDCEGLRDAQDLCMDQILSEFLEDSGLEGDENTDFAVFALGYCDGLSSEAKTVLNALDACPDPEE